MGGDFSGDIANMNRSDLGSKVDEPRDVCVDCSVCAKRSKNILMIATCHVGLQQRPALSFCSTFSKTVLWFLIK